MLDIWYVASPTKFKMMHMGPKWPRRRGHIVDGGVGGLRLKVRCGDGIFWCVDLLPSYIFKYLLKYEKYGFPAITYV